MSTLKPVGAEHRLLRKLTRPAEPPRGPAFTPAKVPAIFIDDNARAEVLGKCIRTIRKVINTETACRRMGLSGDNKFDLRSFGDLLDACQKDPSSGNAALMVARLDRLILLVGDDLIRPGILTTAALGGSANKAPARLEKSGALSGFSLPKDLGTPRIKTSGDVYNISSPRALFLALRMSLRIMNHELIARGFKNEALVVGAVLDVMVAHQKSRIKPTRDGDGDTKRSFSPSKQRGEELTGMNAYLGETGPVIVNRVTADTVQGCFIAMAGAEGMSPR